MVNAEKQLSRALSGEIEEDIPLSFDVDDGGEIDFTNTAGNIEKEEKKELNYETEELVGKFVVQIKNAKSL